MSRDQKVDEQLENRQACTVENCDLFDFMANYVGLSVLHPGGLKATEELANMCGIDKTTRVIDIACGKGSTAVFLAQQYGCKVMGIDILEDLIAEAKELAARKGVSHLVEFRIADALDLPFSDNEFDIAVSQAMLILVDDMQKAVEEALRVVKPGGYAGWIELSWKEEPSSEFMKGVTGGLGASCMKNVFTFNEWEELFRKADPSMIRVHKNDLEFNGMKGMISEEGFKNTMNVMFNCIKNSKVRERIKRLNNFILANPQYFGYGIYICEK